MADKFNEFKCNRQWTVVKRMEYHCLEYLQHCMLDDSWWRRSYFYMFEHKSLYQCAIGTAGLSLIYKAIQSSYFQS